MNLFEDRIAQFDTYKRNKGNAKTLETNNKTTSSNDIVSFEGKGKEDTSSISSSSPIAGEEVAA